MRSKRAEKQEQIQRKIVYNLTNFTVLAALLKQVLLGFEDAVLPERLTKKHTVNCQTYDEDKRKPYNDNRYLLRGRGLRLLDLLKKLRKCSHFSQRKLQELIQQLFKVFVRMILQL